MSTIPSESPMPLNLEFIRAQPEENQLALYGQLQRELSGRASNADGDVDLDAYLIAAKAGIAEALRRAGLESDPARSRPLIDQANVFSFNLLADLAECWPGERTMPERRHFEEGLAAAENCIRWREELGKPNDRQAMPWWGKGMHLLSLDRIPEALEAFRRAVELVMPQGGMPDAMSSFDQLLYSGYLAIAESLNGNADARGRYESIIEAFRMQIGDAEKKEDAEFGIAQLETVAGRFLRA